MKNLILTITILLLSVISLSAKTITVTSSADSGAGTLRQAVLDAASGDVIVFADNVTTITLLSPINIEKNLIINGNEQTNTIISSLAGTVIDGVTRYFYHFFIKENQIVSVNYLTITKGYNPYCASAIYNNGTLNANSCQFINNVGQSGTLKNGGNLTMTNCVFQDNSCSMIGGGITNSGTTSIVNCIFNNNYGSNGGAIYSKKKIEIDGCSFNNNSGQFGGAIINYGGTVHLKNSTLKNNRVTENNYGVIHNNPGGTIIISNCNIIENRGRLCSTLYNDGGTVSIINTLVSKNTATGSSPLGTIVNTENTNSLLTIINSTIADNSINGLYNANSDTIYNSVFWNNGEYDVFTKTEVNAIIHNSLIGTSNIDLSGNNNLIGSDPLFIGNSDYSLHALSPAIDAGSNGFYSYTNYPKDLAGNYRIDNTTIDLGAYEFQSDVSAIKTPSAGELKIDNNNHQIIVENATEPVAIYDMMGQLVASGVETTGFTVPQAGVYLVCIGRQQVKVLIK